MSKFKIVIDLAETGYEPGDEDLIVREIAKRLNPMGIWPDDIRLEAEQ